ncbi:MAG: phosphonopyruvate decarboxylase [Methyloligellaceae bacterium]
MSDLDQSVHGWQRDICTLFLDKNINQVTYVPDGGHRGLIQLCQNTSAIQTTVLTSEQEGISFLSGAWLGGARGALLMQSSGVGNCVNLLTLVENCRIPLLMLVTMRGEWGEFVPWQVPMGQRTQKALELMNTDVYRVESASEVQPTVSSCIDHCYNSNRAVAVLISQKLIGTKNWNQ